MFRILPLGACALAIASLPILAMAGDAEPHAAGGTATTLVVHLPPGHTLVSPPLRLDRRFDGALGAQLAAGLHGDDGGPAAGADSITILPPGATNETQVYLDGNGRWVTAPGIAYTNELAAGHGFIVTRRAGAGASVEFHGIVPASGSGECAIPEGRSIVGLSEGHATPLEAPFASPQAGRPSESFDETKADQLAFLNADGSWHRFIRVPGPLWFDLASASPATNAFLPGQACYYIRRAGQGPLVVRY